MESEFLERVAELEQSFKLGNHQHCLSLIPKLKLLILDEQSLVPNSSLPLNVNIATRTVFEIGALSSIRLGDTVSFGRFAQQLEPFYLCSDLSNSECRSMIYGLVFLELLAENKIAEFHSRLESLPDDLIEKDPFISWVVALESAIMEGAFDRIRTMVKDCPCSEYEIFLSILMQTVRNEIANCSEEAYSKLPIQACASLHFIDNMEDFYAFAGQRNWTIKNNYVAFSNNLTNGRQADFGTDSKEIDQPSTSQDSTLVSRVIEYGRELEQII